MKHSILLSLLLPTAAACDRKPAADVPSPPPPPPAAVSPAAADLSAHPWTLVVLGERPNPLGAGGKAPDLTFAPATSRASGFAGCNRFSGNFTVAGDSLHFGPLLSTKMACPGNDQVEVGYLAALGAVVTYTLADSSLILHGPGGAKLAEFRHRP
jgi:heat shock protein HslJ